MDGAATCLLCEHNPLSELDLTVNRCMHIASFEGLCKLVMTVYPLPSAQLFMRGNNSPVSTPAYPIVN